jgi:hypothetical protein
MGSFSNRRFGLVTNQALKGNSISSFVLLSLGMHAGVLLWKNASEVTPAPYVQAKEVSGLHLQIKGTAEAIPRQDVPIEKTAVSKESAYILQPLLPSYLDIQKTWLRKPQVSLKTGQLSRTTRAR